ncbi:MAG TPA: hypothetical protein VK724_10310 [Bryobacteraceae bacterium]|jgi:hypothetical protein|nr:hypothetical protein [Bryobacteraceae bacterium]
MSDETKNENAAGHGGFEHQDLQVSGILYFLLSLVVGVLLCILLLRGVYVFLDHREKALQPAVNPLVTNVPADTRHIAPGYPQSAFPNPKLEEDERGQLNGILLQEENTLYSYGWVDEKAGTVRIPIERAMELIVQRGLPVRPQGTAGEAPTGAEPNKNGTATKGKKK